MRILLSTLAALLLLTAPAFAWNKAGHMVSAAIAHAVLKQEHPEAIPKIVAILKQHPQYESSWAKRIEEMKNLSDADKDIYLFMLAARWPDDIRDTSEYHHGDWHFINFPYLHPNHPPAPQPLPAPRDDNILRAFEVNRGHAKTGTPAERAIAMCWIFHLIGDGHQPLHTSNLYSATYPRGDKGGNSFYIRVQEGKDPISLHKFWDDLIIGSDRFNDTRNRATELRLNPEFAKIKLRELREANFEKWLKDESFALVDKSVYRHGELAGSEDKAKAPILPADYPKVTKPIAERRIVLAGYRIAEVARQLAK